jgi:hypothetical protein
MKCWEFMECGRQSGGSNTDRLGVCPAYPNNGENCYLVAGTFCDGKVLGTFAQEKRNCQNCEFFQKIHKPRLMTVAVSREEARS